MLAKCGSASLNGIEAFPVEVEVNVSGKGGGFSGEESPISIVGLADLAVRESKDRIRSALTSSNLKIAKGVSVVNLAPADMKKEGAAFDLPIAVGLLAGSGIVDPERVRRTLFAGELALDGSVRSIKGALPIGVAGAENGFVELIVPLENAAEAALGAGKNPDLLVYGVKNLSELVEFLNREKTLEPTRPDLDNYFNCLAPPRLDFADVKGQFAARRGLLIAAAGGHAVLMHGSPGTGKTLMAERLPGILPPFTLPEALDASKIHSVMGFLSGKNPILRERPFRAPHHTISDVGLIGGGRDPRPGEISLAHGGVLFMDEFPEFKRNVLEVLRQPLENGFITVSRAAGSCRFPADFMLVAAMNPCPCGRGEVELGCKCKADEKRRYLRKISGPLLDRIDLVIEVRQLGADELVNAPAGENSEQMRAQVIKAREIQSERFKDSGIFCNSAMTSKELRKYAALGAGESSLLRQLITKFKLSPRAYDRILKVSRTIADLGGSDKVTEQHIFESATYRRASFEEI